MNTSPNDMRIGFVGLGNMGAPMAANIARKGAALTVYDADPQITELFAKEHGCRAARDAATLGANADLVVTMLPTGAIVRSVLLSDGLADALGAGGVVIDMSSSEPVGTRALGDDLRAHGLSLVDAPVSGGVPKAVDGTLAIMIGADDEPAAEKAEPILRMMGDRLFRAGRLGNGHAIKALNNFVAAAAFTAASEALIAGERFGLDRTTILEIINASTGRNFNTEIPMKDHVLTRSFGSGFQLGLMAKDVKIAGDLVDAVDIKAPVSSLIRELWADASATVGATEDFTKAITRWEAKNGVSVD